MNARNIVPGLFLEVIPLNRDGQELKSTYTSQVISITKENTLVLSAPVFNNNPITIKTKRNLKFIFYNDKGVFSFYGEVVKLSKIDNAPTIEILKKSQVNKIQLREYYRLNCSIPLLYKFVKKFSDENINIMDISSSSFLSSSTNNVSGGGLGFVSANLYDIKDLLEIVLQLNDSLSVRALVEVARCQPIPKKTGSYFIGVTFKTIKDKDRTALIRYILDKQRTMIKKGIITNINIHEY